MVSTGTKLGLIIACLVFLRHVTGYNISDVKKLKKTLFEDSGYDNTIRPQINQSEATVIHIVLSLTSLLDFDLASGGIAMTGYLYAFWFDEQLLWNPLHFNGITNTEVGKDVVWHPNLRNAFDLQNSFIVSHISVYCDGRVIWIPTNVFQSVCNVDITYYPYDEHECHFPVFPSSRSFIKFTSMQTTVHMLNYVAHGEWEVVSSKAGVMEVYDPQYQVETSTFLGTIRLRRRPRFAVLHTYFPLLLLYGMNMLTCLVPLGQGERVSFSITVLLALIFFMASVTATFPQSSLKTSYFSATITLAICASSLGVMLSVIFVKLDVTTTRVPRLLRYIMRGSFKMGGKGKNAGRFKKRNTVLALKGSNAVLALKGSPNTISIDDDHVAGESEIKKNQDNEVTDTITWSGVSEKLNMVVFWIYSFLLVISVTVLIILHHYR